MTKFLRTTLAAILTSILVGSAGAQTDIRIVASNITSGNNQQYITAGTNILDGLNPDVILMQEFNLPGTNDAAAVTAWVNSTFGAGYQWVREPLGGGVTIPNGVISKYPILASGVFDDTRVPDRNHVWARIDVPGTPDLYVISVHLWSGGGASGRNQQAGDIMNSMIPGLSIPAGSYIALGGDFNTDNRTESCVTTFSSLFVTGSPYPVGQDGDPDTNANRNKPYDWVVANSTLNALKTSTVYGTFTYTNGLVMDTRDFTQTQLNNEFSPAQVSDSGDTNMQHMAVVRTFTMPSGLPSDFSLSSSAASFGTVDAALGPFFNSTVTLNVTNPFTLNSPVFTGTSAGEFTLTSPSLPAVISSNTPLTFRWSPPVNNGVARNVNAAFTTSGTPASFNITLTGTPFVGGGGGGTLDISGWVVRQTNSTQSYTFPGSTTINEGDFVIVGRDVDKSAFEAFWGVTLLPNVHYFRSTNGLMPAINADEQFSIENGSGTLIDPTSGLLPTTGLTTGLIYRRDATSGSTFSTAANTPASNATPGTFAGTASGTGKLVITEIADATASVDEYIEFYYDAATSSVAEWSMY